MTVTTTVHTFDTSDRENDSAVTNMSANFNAAVTDSIRNLSSNARADMPTTDDIAINDYVDPHITSHQEDSILVITSFVIHFLMLFMIKRKKIIASLSTLEQHLICYHPKSTSYHILSIMEKLPWVISP